MELTFINITSSHPENFNLPVKATNHFHSYHTRSVTNVPHYLKTVTPQHTKSYYLFNGVKIWNKILLEIKNLLKQSSKWLKINKISQC